MPNWLIFVIVMTAILGPILGFSAHVLLHEYEAARAGRTHVGDVDMALAGWAPVFDHHLQLFATT